MAIDLAKIHELARASLMPDFFAVRIDEEGLFADLRQVIAKIKLATPNPEFDRVKQISAANADATSFIEAIKRENLFVPLRNVLTMIPVA